MRDLERTIWHSSLDFTCIASGTNRMNAVLVSDSHAGRGGIALPGKLRASLAKTGCHEIGEPARQSEEAGCLPAGLVGCANPLSIRPSWAGNSGPSSLEGRKFPF